MDGEISIEHRTRVVRYLESTMLRSLFPMDYVNKFINAWIDSKCHEKSFEELTKLGVVNPDGIQQIKESVGASKTNT